MYVTNPLLHYSNTPLLRFSIISKVVEKTRCELDHVVVVDDGSTDRISIIFLMNLFWKDR